MNDVGVDVGPFSVTPAEDITLTLTLTLTLTSFSVNAVGVDIAPFSAMAQEEEILLLPGLPLVNQRGINPEPDLGAFQIETPYAAISTGKSPSTMIDYVHPGT